YFNVNLAGFTRPTNPDCPVRTGPGSAIDQIGQFYGNLALWLSPAATRFRMAEAMFSWLAQHPRVSEELVPRPEASIDEKMRAGVVARRLLARVSSPCEVHELMNLTISRDDSYVEPFETLYLPEKDYNLGVLPSKELLLGSLINRYPRELPNDSGGSQAHRKEHHEKIRDAFNNGVRDAFEAQASKVVEFTGRAQKFLAEVRLRASNLVTEEKTRRGVDAFSNGESAERSNDMSVCATAGWSMTLKNSVGTETRFFFVGVTVTGGILKGRVLDSVGNETPLSGTCNPFGGTTVPPNLSLMSFEFTTRGSGGGLVRIFTAGYGFTVQGAALNHFAGRFVAFAEPQGGVSDSRLTLTVDPGDTGTGSGQQT
ncbi:MAG TPA: hypothetical protein VGV38_21390, partial [Pyrinomonadaceae bacterium]|nr:hypothetical protein [Pyrinomonadaceae bacterium]